MTDLTYTNDATERTNSPGVVPGKGNANVVQKLVCASVELAASASGTTVFLGRIPANARILPTGLVYNDDLATSGSPTLDLGLGSVDSNVTSDPDALNNGLVASSATSTTTVMADAANAGKRAWEFINGQTTDPGGSLDVYLSVKDAATNAAGSIAVEINGYFD